MASSRPQSYPVEYLDPNPFQPRLAIDEAELTPLVVSIQRFGFQGNLVARPNPDAPARRLQLVFGHRRLEAAKRAGLATVPVVVVDRSDKEMGVQAYLENRTQLQMTPWEEACFFKCQQDLFNLSVRDAAEQFERSKGYVQNRLDLLRIEASSPIRPPLEAGTLEMTHAMALHTIANEIPSEDLRRLVERAVAGELTRVAILALGRVRHLAEPGQDQPASPMVATANVAAPLSTDMVEPVEPEQDEEAIHLDEVVSLDWLIAPVDDVNTALPVSPLAPAMPGAASGACGGVEDTLIASGMLALDGRDLRDADEATRDVYLVCHAVRELRLALEGRITKLEPARLSQQMRDELADDRDCLLDIFAALLGEDDAPGEAS